MKRLLQLAVCTAVLAAMPIAQQPAAAEPAAQGSSQDPAQGEPLFKPFDRAAYEQHMRRVGATDAQLAVFGKEVGELGLARAADNLMRTLNADYAAAVKACEAGEPRGALDLTKVLASTEDPVLQGHVRYQLARVFLDADDPERAIVVLEDYLKKNSNHIPLDDEVVFFYAQALSDVPQPEAARDVFKAFLKWFPNASERYRATAHQRAQELDSQLDSDLHKLADGMKKVGRDLKKQETGEPTQEKQKELVTKLQELIEMYEELEKKKSGPPKGNKASSSPANKSGLPEGDGSVGNQNKITTLADRWGDMKDKDRKAIEAEVQNNLPPQYKKMLEEYYKKLGTSEGK